MSSTFKLDGRDIPFEPGDTIIRAAWRQGIEIPHYCWHPGLSVAANCRMCLVEIKSGRPMMLPILRWDGAKGEYVDDTKPKLSPACQMPAAEGMEVSTSSEQVKAAQASVQEFLLLNHPVDCPICDQAGECKLQDYWFDHQHELKRKSTEPVHKPKAVRFGPTIVYDAERCVMCTRCIRFCDEVVHDHVLDMRERGNKNEIVVSPGRELDHDYTLMTEHVCPVGALTSKDFRFKARVWFLRTVPSVCDGCATGCNSFMDFDPRYQRVERLRPRDNLDVNRFWMCDDGMMTYKRIQENRLLAGLVRGADSKQIDAAEAIVEGANLLRAVPKAKIGVVLSAQCNTEDNFVLMRLARDVLGTDKVYLAALSGWKGDDILRNPDNNPNRKGAEQVAGRALPGLETLLADIGQGHVEGVVALGWAASETEQQLEALRRIPMVSLTSHEGVLPSLAKVVVPIAAHGEVSGSFVNAKGMSQSFKRAFPPPSGIVSGWETVIALARALGSEALGFTRLQDVRAVLPAQPLSQATEAHA